MVDAPVQALHDLPEELTPARPRGRIAGTYLGVQTDLVRARGDDDHAPQFSQRHVVKDDAAPSGMHAATGLHAGR